MADYYPLLARALEALPDRTPAMRRAVYERARNALVTQLRSIEPPLSESDIDVERKALDAAITRLEASYDVPAPANDAATPPAPPAPAPERAGEGRPPEPKSPEPKSSESRSPESRSPEPKSPEPRRFEPKDLQTRGPEARRPEPAAAPVVPEPTALPETLEPAASSAAKPEPFLPPAPPPRFVPPPEPETPREPAIAIAAPRTATAESAAEPPAAPVPPEPAEPEAADPAAAAAESLVRGDGPGGRQRPRIDVVAPRSRSRLLRNAFVGAVLALVIGLIAVAAYWLRDKPAEIQAGGQAASEGQAAENADAKFSDRIGGEPAPAERPAPQPAPAPDGSGRSAAPAQPDLAVAQRASLAEEAQGGADSQPVISQGRTIWRLESVSGEQGQPLETAVVATVTIPDAGLTLVMTLQRNLDATLPASHTVSLAFSATGPDAAKRSVQEVGLLQPKEDEAGRGAPVAGLPVRVRENLFLIGLSSLRGDVERNTELLLNRNWFDLGLRYASGQRAVITFEKGSAGAQVMQRAFQQWR